MKQVSAAGLLAMSLTACSEGPAPTPREYPDMSSAGASLLVNRCTNCHIAPHPAVHVAEAWPKVLHRMEMRMRSRGYPVLSDADARILLDYLQAHAKSAVN